MTDEGAIEIAHRARGTPRIVNRLLRRVRDYAQVKGNGVIDEKIAKDATIAKVKQLMEGVVKNGSGKGLNITAFKVGGKTGTAQIAKNGDYKKGGTTYQGSFVGYFPADNPLYTCIVIINSPSKGNYYGGLVAAPVFKEIAEKVYSNSVDFLKPVNSKSTLLTKVPEVITTKPSEISSMANYLEIPNSIIDTEGYSHRNKKDTTKITMSAVNLEQQLKRGVMPDLSGLSAKDALFLLENKGVYVKIQGFGIVKKQSIEAGQKFNKGNKITLTLS